MKKISLIILIIMLSLIIPVIAQEEKPEEALEGMQVIELGTGSRVIIPRGVKFQKKGSQLVIEDYSIYLEKRLKNVDDSLAQLKATEEKLKDEIEQLKETIQDLQKSGSNPPEQKK
jgi:peptidoglycan hydrolase CwlO-like protein